MKNTPIGAVGSRSVPNPWLEIPSFLRICLVFNGPFARLADNVSPTYISRSEPAASWAGNYVARRSEIHVVTALGRAAD